MSKFERFVNNAMSTLNGSINASQTTLVVTNATTFPTDGNFRILIESELMLVTAVSGTTFTVTRALEGTVGSTHGNGVDITAILTEGALEKDSVETIGQHSIDSPKMGGLTDKDGTILTKSDFTEVNVGSATFSDFDNGIKLDSPGDVGDDFHLLVRSIPSTPYTITVALTQFYFTPDNTDQPQAGIGWRDSSTGRLHLLISLSNPVTPFGYAVARWTNVTTFNSTDFPADSFYAATNARWLQIEDDNVDFKFRVSPNGVDWVEIISISRTAWLATPDQYVFCMNPSGSNTTLSLLTYWKYLSII